MLNKHRILLTLLIVLSIVLVACGGDAENGGNNDENEDTVALTQNVSTEEPSTGGTLLIRP